VFGRRHVLICIVVALLGGGVGSGHGFAQVFTFQLSGSVVENFAALVPEFDGRMWDEGTLLYAQDGYEPIAVVYESAPAGYIVTTRDTDFPPVIAYSTTSGFYWDDDGHNALLDMLRYDLSRRLEALEECCATPDRELERNPLFWDELGGADVEFEVDFDFWGQSSSVRFLQASNAASAATAATCWMETSRTHGPALKTSWGQQGACNDLCPLDSITGGQSRTGCAATAMAQILYYWRQPASVTLPAQSYSWFFVVGGQFRQGALVKSDASLSSIPYGNEAACQAPLSYAAGVSVEMKYSEPLSVISGNISRSDYGPIGAIATAFRTVWGYSSAVPRRNGVSGDLLFHVAMSVAEAASDAGIQQKAVYPAILAVPRCWADVAWKTDEDLHLVVCDGFRSVVDDEYLFFSIKYGWDGRNDGYYCLPCGYAPEYNLLKAAVCDIHP